jgi:hypothetical protein
MAINPNTDFVAGNILTASQQNRFPRGVMALNNNTATDASVVNTEEVTITSSAFTAVANRYYRITYTEPELAFGTGYIVARLRQTNLAGTQLQRADNTVNGTDRFITLVWVGTFTAGSTVVVATLQNSSGTSTATRGPTFPAQLIVEDIGPA